MKKTPFTLATVLFIVLATGCSGGLDYMIEEYNSRFGIHDDTIPLPGDLGYNSANMILTEYHVDINNTLNIPAPVVGGATYKWQVFKDEEEITKFRPNNGMTSSTFHLWERDLAIGTYTLKLTVTIGDTVLTDEALVTVHEENSGRS